MSSNDDPIKPSHIDHTVDEIWDGDNLEQRYNFLDYHFEEDGAYLRARIYLDEPSKVTLFGPFASKGSVAKVAAPEIEMAVQTYLGRRFRTVERR